jgi:hypothetical protein
VYCRPNNIATKRCEAVVWSFPRQNTTEIRKAIQSLVPSVGFDATNLDELAIRGMSFTFTAPVNVSVWEAVLSVPVLRQACVLLRLVVQAEFLGGSGKHAPGRSTLVLCGKDSFYRRSTPRHDEPAIYRKSWRPKSTLICAPEGAGLMEILHLHQTQIDRLIASGAVPAAPPGTAEEVLDSLRKENAESRELWRQHPYTWSDALHDGFKVCRKEYLPPKIRMATKNQVEPGKPQASTVC